MSKLDKSPLNLQVQAGFFLWFCLLLALFAVPRAQAAVVEITAVFSPDPANPNVNEFINTTPTSGLCLTFPSMCKPPLYSIRLGMEPTTQYAIPANPSSLRDSAMFKVPADTRTVQVTSPSGQTAEVAFSITAFSATIRTNPYVNTITSVNSGPFLAHDALWGQNWSYFAAAPCTLGAQMTALSYLDADFFWFTPVQQACGKLPKFEIPWLRLRNTSVAYRMTTPDPLSMESGTYVGSITYSIGPNGDFDFGDNLTTSVTEVTFNLSLDVQHTLKFQFPANYNRISLYPAGGWQQWLDRGRRPEALAASQAFNIWASTPLSVELQCEYTEASQCGIRNPAGHTVTVDTRITLPNGLRDASSQPVNRYLLTTTPTIFSPSHYVDNGAATLQFNVERDQVASMIADHSGSTYRGTITVIFDSELH